jgi:hypothetical protein
MMGSFTVVYNESIDLGVTARVAARIDFIASNRLLA